ncbi:MAG: branched-chain amino acid ABC transporter permease [Deltaproteobacteria bacterium]|nr:branched-chain amino acid ABC transporter permease [Deltaproteobacteria bacterium]
MEENKMQAGFRWEKCLSYGIVGAVLLLLPLFVKNPSFIDLVILANIYAVYAASWDLLSGYSGQINFGHSLFIGGGAYTAGFLNFYLQVPPVITIFLGGLVAALLGLIIGIPCLRIRGPYLALATFAASAVPLGLASVYWEYTGGDDGLYGIAPLTLNITGKYYLSLFLLFVCGGILLAIGRSKKGLILKSIREDELGAMASGINTTRFKLITFIVSGFFAGIAGAFYTHNQLHVGTETLSLHLSILVVIMSVVGGMGTITGPIAGAFLLTIFNEMLRGIEEVRLLIYTLSVVFILLFMPKGVLPTLTQGLPRLFR